MSRAAGSQYRGELLRNQLWPSANFVSKALFLVALTPLMLDRWGAEQFGLFALASSLLVSMALLAVTVPLTGLMMLTLLGLEPLAARGRLSSVKEANTWGALAAMPVVGAAVALHAGVLTVVILYSACLIVPNLVYARRGGVFALRPWAHVRGFGPRELTQTLRAGRGGLVLQPPAADGNRRHGRRNGERDHAGVPGGGTDGGGGGWWAQPAKRMATTPRLRNNRGPRATLACRAAHPNTSSSLRRGFGGVPGC